tara:strand:+ start:313 stop:894 length:582 start_codon:yes stop_codon:yes gene_type:complete
MADGTLKVGTITTSSGSGTITLGQSGETITSSAALGSGMGKVLQVVSTAKSDTFTTTSTSFTDVTDLSVSITPSSSSNKIFITTSFQFGANSGSGYPQFRMLRDSTVINAGTASGSRSLGILSMNIYNADTASGSLCASSFLDSPATTSATIYKIQSRNSGGNTTYVGSNSNDADAATSLRSASTITVMEIAG